MNFDKLQSRYFRNFKFKAWSCIIPIWLKFYHRRATWHNNDRKPFFDVRKIDVCMGFSVFFVFKFIKILIKSWSSLRIVIWSAKDSLFTIGNHFHLIIGTAKCISQVRSTIPADFKSFVYIKSPGDDLKCFAFTEIDVPSTARKGRVIVRISFYRNASLIYFLNVEKI